MKTTINRWQTNQVWNHLRTVIILGIFSALLINELSASGIKDHPILHKTIEVDGVEIFYREAGSKTKPTILLLHGFPTSSHMFRNLMRDLSADYHLLAPDYPGFGRSEQPAMSQFEYSFDNLARVVDGFLDALKVQKFSLYLMDYGAPIGYRIANKYPERVQGLIIQNGNAYEEGLREFWDPIKKFWNNNSEANGKPLAFAYSAEGVKWQYTHGVQNVSKISPDNWEIDMQHLNRPGNSEIQLALFYDYRTNVKLYPSWQKYFKTYQPPALIVWGKNDHIFPAEGAYPYKKHLDNVDFHLLNTGHFALEEEGEAIARHIDRFMKKNKIK